MMSDLSESSILVLEDDEMLQARLLARLRSHQAEVATASTLAEARRLLANTSFDYALLDVQLPDGESLDLLREEQFSPNTIVVVMTAHGGVKGAVAALRLGASDYLTKPFELEELPLILTRSRREHATRRREEHRRQAEWDGSFFFGNSLSELEGILGKILESDRRRRKQLQPVLIEGETGTGKTTIARWLHRNGPLASEDLVEVNCSAFPEALAESELFGHERGAFTDAKSARLGLFEAAGKGTLFLDEISSLSLPLQAKVLTAIEDRKIRRVGANRPVRVEARIIAASNSDLKSMVQEGRFREDLYHRLDLFRVRIPPLRERGTDILALAEKMIQRICQDHHVPPRTISKVGRDRLLAYPWPGNVRELAHELERAIVFEESSRLEFPRLVHDQPQAAGQAGQTSSDWLNEAALFEGFSLEEAIDRFIQIALQRTGGNVSAAARLLNMPRDFVRYRRSKKHL